MSLRSACQDLDSDSPEPSDWDKYAAEEYEILVAEETANEQLQEGWASSPTIPHTHSHVNCLEWNTQNWWDWYV